MAEDKIPVLRKWIIKRALFEATKYLKEKEEKEFGPSFRSNERYCMEQALEAFMDGRPVRIDMSGD